MDEDGQVAVDTAEHGDVAIAIVGVCVIGCASHSAVKVLTKERGERLTGR